MCPFFRMYPLVTSSLFIYHRAMLLAPTIRCSNTLKQSCLMFLSVFDQVTSWTTTWLPDGYSWIYRIICVWPFGLLDYGSAPLRCAAKCDPFLSLDCAPTPSTLAQSKERKGSNFAIWQPCDQDPVAARHGARQRKGSFSSNNAPLVSLRGQTRGIHFHLLLALLVVSYTVKNIAMYLPKST